MQIPTNHITDYAEGGISLRSLTMGGKASHLTGLHRDDYYHLSGKAISLIKDFCIENGVNAIRMDTQAENKVMQHILSREGFEYCGLITLMIIRN